MGLSADELEGAIDEKKMARMEAIVLSMTPEERANPKLLSPQRKYRIAKGSGNDIADVNRFIKQFRQMQEMVKKMPGLAGRKHHGNPFGGFGMGRRGSGNPFAGGGRFPF
jgi:signal recognition particle subunit SRP54